MFELTSQCDDGLRNSPEPPMHVRRVKVQEGRVTLED